MNVTVGVLRSLTSALPIAAGRSADAESRAPATDTEEASGLTPREAAALRRARTLGTLLDDAVRIPGIGYRVGLDPILGVVPVGGDAIAAAVSLYPIVEARRFGASEWTLAKMLLFVGVDAVVGSVPVLGTVFDAVWKANTWNVDILERQIRHG